MNPMEAAVFLLVAAGPCGPDIDLTNSSVSSAELTEAGFRIFLEDSGEDRDRDAGMLGMMEYKGVLFVESSDRFGQYSKQIFDQKKARKVYDEVVDSLLAA